MSDAEVKVRLSLEDDASEELGDVEEELGDVEQAEKSAEGGFKDWAATASHVAQTLGVNLRDVVGKVREVGASFVEAGAKAESGDQAVAALIATAQGKKFDDALDQAERLGDALDDIAISAGVSGDAIGDAYQSILEKTGATEQGIKQATDQLGKMAQVAGKLDKDTGAIANEFAFMQEGQLKVKGQLFQLLQSTGIFGDKTKGVADAWTKLTEEKRAELLSYGLDKLAGTMQAMPPTFKQVEAGLENMWRISKERVGQPLIEQLAPALDEVTQQLVELGPDIDDFAKAMAKDVGAAVREGGRMLRDAVGWLREHKDEIAQGFREGAEKVKQVVEFILAHKEEIALAFGAKTAMPILTPAAGVVADVAKAGYWGAGGGLAGMGTAGIVGATVSLAAFTAAIVAVGLAADQSAKLAHELADAEDTRLGGLRRLQELSASGDVERTENAVRTMAQLDEAAGRMTPQLRQFYDSMVEGARRTQQVEADSAEHLRKQIAIGATGSSNADAMRGAGGKASADVQGYAMNQEWILLNAYNQAMQAGNKQMALLAAQTIASGALVGDAFLKTNQQIEGGLGAMADMLDAAGSEFAGIAGKLRAKAAVPAAPKIVMTGGQTFNLKQDFRDKDPDKIAVVFRRDVGRVIERRASARYSGPFGT